jgi:hypothetical protein
MLEMVNFRVIDDYAYVDVYENNNYVGVFGPEINHVEYTSDINNCMFNQFRKILLEKIIHQEKFHHLKLIK